MLQGFHFRSIEEFEEFWERRRKRFCMENVLVLVILYNENDVNEFRKITMRKLGFYLEQIGDMDIVYIPWSVEECYKGAYAFAAYVYDLVQSGDIFQYFDVFKMLEGDFYE